MDPSIVFPCPQCQRTLRIKDDLAGKKFRCPGCQQVIRVPEPAASASPSPEGKASRPGSLPGERDPHTEQPTQPPANGAPHGTVAGPEGEQATITPPERPPSETLGAGTLWEFAFLAPPQAPDERTTLDDLLGLVLAVDPNCCAENGCDC